MSQLQSPRPKRRPLFTRFLYFYNEIVMTISVIIVLFLCYVWYVRTNILFDPIALAIIFIAVAAMLTITRRRTKTFIPERFFGIVFEKEGNFIQFIDSGTHFIDPFHEELKTKVSKKKLKAEGRMDVVRTKEGIPVTLFWKAEFFFDVDHILKVQNVDHAYGLLSLPPGKVIGLTNGAIRDAVEQKNVTDLYKVKDNEPLLYAFEDLIMEIINPILNGDTLFKNDSYKVFIGPILFPNPLEKALEEASQQNVWRHPFNLAYKNSND